MQGWNLTKFLRCPPAPMRSFNEARARVGEPALYTKEGSTVFRSKALKTVAPESKLRSLELRDPCYFHPRFCIYVCVYQVFLRDYLRDFAKIKCTCIGYHCHITQFQFLWIITKLID